jgi:sulfite reductase beta subunit-like hemoprotein
VLRQWSTLHPEFAHLPRKFKIAVSGALEDRAAIGWHDVGLQLRKNAAGEVGFEVAAGENLARATSMRSLPVAMLSVALLLIGLTPKSKLCPGRANV